MSHIVAYHVPAGKIVRLKQKLALAHETEDAFVVDRISTRSPTCSVEQSCNPAIAVGRSCVGELSDGGQQLIIAAPLISTTALGCATELLDEVGA